MAERYFGAFVQRAPAWRDFFWFRKAPESDGKSKLDHVHDMLTNCVYQKQLQFQTVLMDTWYATKDAMLYIEQLGKLYYCPLKDNRQVDDSGGCCSLSAGGLAGLV